MSINTLSYPGHARALLVLGLPLMGGHLAQFAIGLTDTIMIGWYGVDELAALTLATSWFFVLFLFGAGFAWAVMPMVASYNASGDQQMVRRATRMGLWLSILFFLAAFPLLWWSKPILMMFGQTEELAAEAQLYLRIAGFGMLPALCVLVLKSYLAAMERTQVILWITVAAAGVNILGNYALIFGNFGLPELGIRGAAISSLIVQLVSILGVAGYAVLTLPEHGLFQRFWRPDAEVFRSVFNLGWPIGLTSFAEVGLFVGGTLMMGWLGTVTLAAHGIVMQIVSATFMIHLGLSNAATVRAGASLGKGDIEGLSRTAQMAILSSVIVALVTTFAFLQWPENLINLFLDKNEPQLRQILSIGILLLAMGALFQLFDGTQAVALGLLRGLQDTTVPMQIAAFSYWVVGLGSSYGFGFVLGWGASGVWMGLILGLVVASALLLLRFWRNVLPGLRMAAP